MSDPSPPPPPRVHLTLPGGAVVEARLLGWQQADDGSWLPEVALTVPAGAVTRVDGEDYAAVPRVSAPARYVLVTSTPPKGRPTMELHLTTCFTLGSVAFHQRVTPVGSADLARDALRFPDTSACDLCKPEP